jgi:lipopolysaccharide biosynthesis glycosyltransferase
MTEYRSVGFIDSDAILLRNIDEAFALLDISDYPLAGCMDIRSDFQNPMLDDVFQGHINAGGAIHKGLCFLYSLLTNHT